MVARDDRRTGRYARSTEDLFLEWRRVLARGMRAARTVAAGTGPTARTASAAVSEWTWGTLSDVRDANRPLPVALGLTAIAAVAVSTALGLALGTLGDGTLVGALFFSSETIAWGLFRLVVLTVLSPQRSGPVRSHTFAAWAAGLLPFAVGVTPELRAIAFAASAVLTHRLLLRVRDRSSARLAVGVAFGGQAMAATASWLILNGLLFLAPVAR